MRKFFRRFLKILLGLIVLLGILFLARAPILRSIGNFLIVEDTYQSVDAAFVLSGGIIERTREASNVYAKDSILLICMGETISSDLKAYGLSLTDADLANIILLRMGVDSSDIRILKKGTSTFEESEEILGYSLAENFNRIMIISSKFHTRRIKRVFKKKFRENGIEVVIRGAEPERYKTDTWWLEESGMIFVTNEYLKLLYYAIKY